MKKPIRFLEILGITTIILVILAVLTTYPIVINLPINVLTVSIGLSIFIAVLGMVSIIRLFGKTNYGLLTILGFGLVFMGGLITFLVPEYFQEMIKLPVPFWYKVSWYTLPAIVIEGGILTLFVVLIEKGFLSKFLPRERFLISCTFILYAAATVTMNFLVLDRTLSVTSHVTWTRVVLIIVAAIALLIGFYKALSQRK